MQTWSILLAAGQGHRMGNQPDKKQFLDYRNKPLYWHSVRTFSAVPALKGIVFVFPADQIQNRTRELDSLFQQEQPGLEYLVTSGGTRRQDSSWAALQMLPLECEQVLIHDAARPFLPASLVQDVLRCLQAGAVAAVPALNPCDTIRCKQEGRTWTLPRDSLYAVQTPQGFQRRPLEKAYAWAAALDKEFTDDAAVLEEYGHTIDFVPGSPQNLKLTSPEDLQLLENKNNPVPNRLCLGYGYDVHRYGQGRPMRLGGVPIPNSPLVIAHSDGDVLLHAIMDAILGCLGQGDIGEHFPDSDPDLENANSAVLLSEILHLAQKQGLKILHLDLTIVCEKPKITPWRQQIRKNICSLLYLEQENLGLKASTEEGLGCTAENSGIKAVALLTAEKP